MRKKLIETYNSVMVGLIQSVSLNVNKLSNFLALEPRMRHN